MLFRSSCRLVRDGFRQHWFSRASPASPAIVPPHLRHRSRLVFGGRRHCCERGKDALREVAAGPAHGRGVVRAGHQQLCLGLSPTQDDQDRLAPCGCLRD